MLHPLFESERIYVRALEMGDLVPFWRYRSDQEITKYQGFDVMNLEECSEFIAANSQKKWGELETWIQLGIVLKTSNVLIGDCGVFLSESAQVNASVGITIARDLQQQGFGKETFLGLINVLFNHFELYEIHEIVDAENVASIALLSSLGFQQDASKTERVFFKGNWCDELHFTLLRSNWSQQSNA